MTLELILTIMDWVIPSILILILLYYGMCIWKIEDNDDDQE
jgi:hypothetical protein